MALLHGLKALFSVSYTGTAKAGALIQNCEIVLRNCETRHQRNGNGSVSKPRLSETADGDGLAPWKAFLNPLGSGLRDFAWR
jgi:hypothetical protein